MCDSDCPAGEVCVYSGEWCGFTCGVQWPPPDGVINFQDISCAVATYSGGMSGTTPTDKPNVDLHGSGTGNADVDPPNYLINFDDIGWAVKAFAGYPYPFEDPGDCPDVAVWP